MKPNWEDAEALEAENKRLNDICGEKSSEIYKLRGQKLALEQENKRLRAALIKIANYDGTLVDDQDWPVCLAKEALEGK
jgi:hypothetical protein